MNRDKPPRRAQKKVAPPLDTASLERLAIRYVERFQTTRGKLADYLRRKVFERGWEGEPADTQALAERMATLGYVDDRAFAEAKAAALGRRGLGARRVTGALHAARVGAEDTAHVRPAVEADAVAAVLRYARRKRVGPFSPPADRTLDRAAREKQLAAMLRAGHPLGLARRVLAMTAQDLEDDPELDDPA